MSTPADQFGDFPVSEKELLTWLRRASDEHSIIAVTDAEGVIVYVNDQFCRVSGYGRDELIGQTHRIIRSDFHDDEFFAGMWRTITAGKVWKGTFCNKSKDGRHYWVNSTITPLLDEHGKPRFYLALRTEVTRLVNAEEENRIKAQALQHQVELLHTSRQEMAAFYEHAPIGMSWREFNPDGSPGRNHTNHRLLDIIGLTEEEAADVKNVQAITHPEDCDKQIALTEQLYRGESDQFTLEKRYLRKDGRMIWANLTVVVIRDANGLVSHHFGMLEDITARKRAEEDLKRTESRWRTYLDRASEILYAITPSGTIKFASSAFHRKLGYAVEDVLGRSYSDFVHPDDVDAWDEFFRTTLATGDSPIGFEYRVRHENGDWVWHAITGTAYNDRNDERAFFGVGRDITARREAQEKLKAALARREEMERIVNRSPSVVVLWRAARNWPVEFVSQSVRQYGYDPEYFTKSNQGFIAITHPDDTARVTAEVQAHASAGHDEYNQEYRIVCKDGSIRWVDDHTVVRRDEDGFVTHHEGLITDVTSRKEAEEREREIRERDLRTAGEVQAHLRPRDFPDINEVEIEALSDPSMTIGGDYYDVLRVDDRRWGFVVADVSGKGAGAALMMAECRATMRLCAEGELSPSAVLRRVNHSLAPDMRPGMFIAMFYCILDLDTKKLRFCRAGHEQPLVIRAATGEIDLLQSTGLAVGLDDGELFDEMLDEGETTMRSGDLLVLYTDGITEAVNPNGEEFGRDRMAAALQRDLDRPLAEVVKTVDRYVRNFCVLAPRHDDRTLLLVRSS